MIFLVGAVIDPGLTGRSPTSQLSSHAFRPPPGLVMLGNTITGSWVCINIGPGGQKGREETRDFPLTYTFLARKPFLAVFAGFLSLFSPLPGATQGEIRPSV